jgi:hypothetical protein
MKAFEIHTYQGGRWKIDSVFDDRDLAVFEAQRMDVSGRYPGIRVVEETFHEASNETTNRTMFRGNKVKNVAKKRQLKRRAVQKKSSPVRLILILLLLAGFAGGALFGLSYLDQMM